ITSIFQNRRVRRSPPSRGELSGNPDPQTQPRDCGPFDRSCRDSQRLRIAKQIRGSTKSKGAKTKGRRGEGSKGRGRRGRLQSPGGPVKCPPFLRRCLRLTLSVRAARSAPPMFPLLSTVSRCSRLQRDVAVHLCSRCYRRLSLSECRCDLSFSPFAHSLFPASRVSGSPLHSSYSYPVPSPP